MKPLSQRSRAALLLMLSSLATLCSSAASASAEDTAGSNEGDSNRFMTLLVGGLVGAHLLVIGVVFAFMWGGESKAKSGTKGPFTPSTMEEIKKRKERMGKQD